MRSPSCSAQGCNGNKVLLGLLQCDPATFEACRNVEGRARGELTSAALIIFNCYAATSDHADFVIGPGAEVNLSRSTAPVAAEMSAGELESTKLRFVPAFGHVVIILQSRHHWNLVVVEGMDLFDAHC